MYWPGRVEESDKYHKEPCTDTHTVVRTDGQL
jgi:hypothetical protein